MRHIQYDELAGLVGGKFQLTVLIQKRLRELQRGAKPCVNIESDDPMDIVIEEIRNGAIVLEAGEDVMETLKKQAASASRDSED